MWGAWAGTRALSCPSTYPPAPDPWQDDDGCDQHGEEYGDNESPGGVKGEAGIGSRVEGVGAIPQCHLAAWKDSKLAPRETVVRKSSPHSDFNQPSPQNSLLPPCQHSACPWRGCVWFGATKAPAAILRVSPKKDSKT